MDLIVFLLCEQIEVSLRVARFLRFVALLLIHQNPKICIRVSVRVSVYTLIMQYGLIIT